MTDLTETGVVMGCGVTAQATPDGTVAIGAGRILIANGAHDIAAISIFDILGSHPADASLPRWDLILGDNTSTVNLIVGTPTAPDSFGVVPLPPMDYGQAALAAVFVDAGVTTIRTQDIDESIRTLVRDTDVSDYSVPGTYSWMPPSWAKFARVQVWGGAGGGGGGGRSAGGAATGGGGGGGGGYREKVFLISDLALPVTVTVGAGGTKGVGRTGSAGKGTDGGLGGVSAFGDFPVVQTTYIAGQSGFGGIGGDASTEGMGGDGSGSTGPVGTPGLSYQGGKAVSRAAGWYAEFGGGGGGCGGEPGADGHSGGASMYGGGGGGGGASGGNHSGGTGQYSNSDYEMVSFPSTNRGTPGTPNATDGTDGTSLYGGRGGGGGGCATGTGGKGGKGGKRGGGGGGGAGGGAANQNGGDGEVGGDGRVIVGVW